VTLPRLVACLTLAYPALAGLAPACAGGDLALPVSPGAADATDAADGPEAAGPEGLGPGDGHGGPVPVDLGRLGPSGALVPWAPGAEVEVVQGPQGGIHVEAVVRLEAAGLPDAAFVALAGSVSLAGPPVATLNVDRYTVLLGADGGYTTQVLPIIFFDSLSTTYLGDPPRATPATVCMTAALSDGREGSACRDVTLVDLE
jgi:hypothetical protein